MPLFDLADYETRTKSESGAPMPLLHPRTIAPLMNDDGTPVTITLLGRASDVYRDIFRQLQDERITRMAAGIRATPEDQVVEDTRILVACTKDWNLDTVDGQPFPFSRENAMKLWSDLRFLWIRDAAISFMRNDGNFIPS